MQGKELLADSGVAETPAQIVAAIIAELADKIEPDSEIAVDNTTDGRVYRVEKFTLDNQSLDIE